MVRTWSLLIVALVALTLAVGAEEPQQVLVIQDFAPDDDLDDDERENDVQDVELSLTVGEQLEPAELDHFRALLLNSEADCHGGILEKLGFSEQGVANHLAEIQTAAFPLNHPRRALPWPTVYRELIEYPAIRSVIKAHFSLERIDDEAPDDAETYIKVEIPGEPPISLSSSSNRPGLLPWKITVGDDERLSFCSEISEWLAKRLPENSPHRVDLDVAGYATSGALWKDGRIWQAVGAPICEDRDLRVEFSSHGCFHSHEEDNLLTLEGELLHSVKARFPAEILEQLRVLAVKDKTTPGEALDAIGFTREAVEANQRKLLEGVIGRPPLSVERIPDEMLPLFEYEKLAPRIRKIFVDPSGYWSTTTNTTVVDLPGDPVIRLVSSRTSAWMLPWTVTIGDKARKVYTPEIPRLLGKLVENSFEVASQLNADEYMKNEFWTDHDLWSDIFDEYAEELDDLLARGLITAIRGFEAAEERVEITEVTDNLMITAQIREPRLINEIIWTTRIGEQGADSDWHQLLSSLDRQERFLAQHTWLKDWLQARPDRSLAVIFPIPADDEYYGNERLRAWRESDLGGKPVHRFELRDQTDDSEQAGYFSLNDDRVMLSSADSMNTEHWVDQLDFSIYSNEAPRVLVVSPNGEHEVHELPRAESGDE